MRLFSLKTGVAVWTIAFSMLFLANLPTIEARVDEAAARQTDQTTSLGPSHPDAAGPASIPWSEVGRRVSATSRGEGISITATEQGARMETRFQRLAGAVDKNGLSLWSTVKDDPRTRFSIKAAGIGRQDGNMNDLDVSGRVQVETDLVRFLRPGLVEEYSVSVDGVRHDFVITQPPPGQNNLRVELYVAGASAQGSDRGVILTLPGSQRRLAYRRLHVVDARNRILPASLVIESPESMAIIVSDASATYPIRIDPTISDADWVDMGFGTATTPGTNGTVYALAVDAEDGILYVGGSFTEAGGIEANNIAQWDGSAWAPLGLGMDDDVNALSVDGYGNLYAGGYFVTADLVTVNSIAKWNGTDWSALGSGLSSTVWALAVDPSGDVYVGGDFAETGDDVPLTVNYVAKWDVEASTWGALDLGVDSSVFALAVDASGDLYAGGNFYSAGGDPAHYIAKWDVASSTWRALGPVENPGTNTRVYALAVDDSDMLYAGGWFGEAGGVPVNYVAKWNGSTWSAMGSLNSEVRTLIADGDIYAGGAFTADEGTQTQLNHVARWNGSEWEGLGSGVDGDVYALAVYSGYYYVGGGFANAGGETVNYIAKWDLEGSSWEAMPPAQDAEIHAFAVDAAGNVYVGGRFSEGGGLTYGDNIVRWDGTNWSTVGYYGANNTVIGLLADGTDLYACGHFTAVGEGTAANYIAKWDASNGWTPLGSGTNGLVNAMAMDGNGHLYVGGTFTTAGGVNANRVAKWNGTNWSALGDGVGDTVDALAMDDSDLYAGGWFETAGGQTAKRVAKWDGAAWSALGSGFNDWVVKTLVVDGSGNLYAGGLFTDPFNRVAKWDGSAWTTLGSGVTSDYAKGVNALAIDVAGNVYAAGDFTAAGSTPASNIAKWDGTSWSALGSGVDNTVSALAAHGDRLYVGGKFNQAGGKSAFRAAYANLNLELGSLKFTIEPAGAQAEGRWRRTGTDTWHESGHTETNVSAGTYTVEFNTVYGWTTPANQEVTIASGQTTEETATYIRIGPGTYYVDISAAEGGDGSSNNPWKWFHDGIRHINAGSQGTTGDPYTLNVKLAGGSHYSIGNDEPDSELVVSQDHVTIIGESGSAPIIDGVGATLWSSGIKITGANVTLNNLCITGFGLHGVTAYQASGAAIKGCTIHGNLDHGVLIQESSGVIQENLIYDNTDCGIKVSHCSPEISRNQIHDNHRNVLILGQSYPASPIIKNNLIHEATAGTVSLGIEVQGQFDVTVSPKIYHNTIDGGTDTGILIRRYGSGSVNPMIKYNIITNCAGYGIDNYEDYPGNPDLDYNDVWNNATANYSGCSAGTNDISEDPLYGSYDLLPCSPCIDAIPSAAGDEVANDFAGTDRPQPTDGNWDIGAYEFIYQAPVITGFNPTSGIAGTEVTITGNHFCGTSAVSFGGTAATSFTAESDEEITATVGTGQTGQISLTTPGGTVSSDATFTYTSSGDTGSLSVTIEPEAARTAGAQWRRTGTSTWFDSGNTETDVPVGSHTVEFKTISGWTKPADKSVTISKDQTATTTGTYTQDTGSLSVTIEPEEARTAGAQWRRTGTSAWYNSGDTETDVPVGSHTVEFKTITGWTKPANKSVTVSKDQTVTASGTYTQSITGGTYYVDISAAEGGDGSQANPWKWFHDAIGHINAGSAGNYVLYVAVGIYSRANNEPDAELILTQDNVTIIGEMGSGPVLAGAGSIHWQNALSIAGSNVTLENLYLTGFGNQGASALYISSGSGNMVRGCRIYSNYDGISVFNAGYCTIIGCEIYNNADDAVSFEDSNHGIITENKIHNNKGSDSDGIIVDGCNPEITRNEIYDNTFQISVAGYNNGTASPSIVNNLIYQATSGAVSYGIVLSRNDAATVSPTIYHNTIDQGTYAGIAVESYGTGVLTPEIKYNIISNFQQYGISNSEGNPVIDYNDVWNNGSGTKADNYKDCDPGPNDLTDGDGKGKNPLYGSYTLQKGSPCIDTIPPGEQDPVRIDFRGFERGGKGDGYDMGAYEYVGPVKFNYTPPGGTGASTDYRIFTVPLDLGKGSAMKAQMEAALGAYVAGGHGRWRVYAYQGTRYREINSSAFAGLDIVPGMGFWIITLDTDEIAFEGMPAPDGVDFKVKLAPGWHLIGLPWIDTDIALGSIRVTDGVNQYAITASGNTLTQKSVWDYIAGGYVQRSSAGYTLQCGTGYWIKVLADREITLIIPRSNEAADGLLEMAPEEDASVPDDVEDPPPPPGSEPIPGITLSRPEGAMTSESGAPVSVAVTLDPGAWTGRQADWWMAAHTPFAPPYDWYSYVYPQGWRVGIHRCVRAPLFEIATPFEVLNMTLPAGAYTFYFAVDGNADGKLDVTWFDSVEIDVE